jgi:hypothetical protein
MPFKNIRVNFFKKHKTGVQGEKLIWIKNWN